MSQTTPPRGALSAAVADVAPALGAQVAGAERLARLSVAPTRRRALHQWNIGWGRSPTPGGARPRGRRGWAAEPDAAHGPSKHQLSRCGVSGRSFPTRDATIQDGGMVITDGTKAASMFPAT